MRPGRQNPHAKLSLLVGLVLLAGCTSGQAIVPGESTTKKDESADDEDKPDQSAPVSGAYLTCYVPPPKDTDEYILGGCQVRDKNKNRMDLSKNDNVRWGFLPPKGAPGRSLSIFDLSHAKTRRFYDAVYQLKLPPKTATSLTQAGSRSEVGRYFLNSIPILTTKVVLLSQARKQAANPSPNSLSLVNQSSFGQISAFFPDPQNAPATPETMLNTSQTGQPVVGETFTPLYVEPLTYDSPDQVVYDDLPQEGGEEDYGEYTTISGEPQDDTVYTEPQGDEYDPYAESFDQVDSYSDPGTEGQSTDFETIE